MLIIMRCIQCTLTQQPIFTNIFLVHYFVCVQPITSQLIQLDQLDKFYGGVIETGIYASMQCRFQACYNRLLLEANLQLILLAFPRAALGVRGNHNSKNDHICNIFLHHPEYPLFVSPHHFHHLLKISFVIITRLDPDTVFPQCKRFMW